MYHWFFLTWHGWYCFASFFRGLSLLVGITSVDKLLFFFLTRHALYCFTSCFTGSLHSSLPGMVCIVSLHASLVRCYLAWRVLFHFPHWFIIIVHDLYSFISCFTVFSLLGIVCIVSLHNSSVLPYWAWLVLFHLKVIWYFISRHCWHWFTSCFTGSVLLGMACIVSFPTLVHHYCAWFVLFHFILHWFTINGHCFYCLAFLTG